MLRAPKASPYWTGNAKRHFWPVVKSKTDARGNGGKKKTSKPRPGEDSATVNNETATPGRSLVDTGTPGSSPQPGGVHVETSAEALNNS